MSYAEHNGKDGTDVYALFRTSGLLDLFETDYDNLHSMSMEYLMQYFDEYLKDFYLLEAQLKKKGVL